jgi:hypothetical protein
VQPQKPVTLTLVFDIAADQDRAELFFYDCRPIPITLIEKKSSPNERITKANADRIQVDKTTITEAELLLGPGTEFTNSKIEVGRKVASGLKGMRWGPGQRGEEIEVEYRSDGRIASVNYVQFERVK